MITPSIVCPPPILKSPSPAQPPPNLLSSLACSRPEVVKGLVRRRLHTGDGGCVGVCRACKGHDEELVMSWTKGVAGVKLMLEHAGLHIFGSGGFRSFSIQTHSTNPELLPGLVNYSGIHIHHSQDAREIGTGDEASCCGETLWTCGTWTNA